MRPRLTLLFPAVITLVSMTLLPVSTRADAMGTNLWIGTGVSWPDYNEKAMACVRGGAAVVLVRYVTLGASGHGDRDHSYYFGDAGLNFPALGMLEPYGRFHIGRRDHSSENAMGWSAGVRLGEDVDVFVEGYGFWEPEPNYGAVFGLAF